MVKRRLAIVVTAAALGLGALAAPALADDGSVRVHGGSGEYGGPDERVRFGGELRCWMKDGKVVRFPRAKVTELIDERYLEPELAETVVENGVTVVPADRLSITVPARELPHRVIGKRWHKGRVIHLTCVWTEDFRR
ncbi:hypothetical protein SAMN05444920_101521 [Nonomuraea solani]|uniref:Uncharacterized protein n=1 Tax=Nonomuraea solani TaxID=1144553 RepID=A0A1H5UHY2_9ACTN|nr:hypothetical protein [Nonomuraea solani]SEF74088.1 hypothetical protein SAMN05444920_101521 [Nonomuraea solani]